MSAFLRTLIAKYSPVAFFFDKYTLPKAPLLIGLMISKSLMDGGTARACGALTEFNRGDGGGREGSEPAADD